MIAGANPAKWPDVDAVEQCQRYPKTFTHEPHVVRPLARGIREAIVADAPDLPASIVSQALAILSGMLPYMRACIVDEHASISVATLSSRFQPSGCWLPNLPML
jgi:hypothetical protein